MNAAFGRQPKAESEAVDAESKQNPKQRACARTSENQKKTNQNKGIALVGLGSRDEQVPVRGLEQLVKLLGNNDVHGIPEAESEALAAFLGQIIQSVDQC